MNPTPTAETALIDRWFPVAAVDEAVGNSAGSGANEKSIFPWFASRPIAQARAAVLCALLIDDSSRSDIEAAIRGDGQALSRVAKTIKELYPERPPVVLDVFSGRGIIPLEAARVGATAVGLDLSPVATVAGRLLAEYPLRDWSAEPSLPWSPAPAAAQLIAHERRPRLVADLEGFLAEIGSRVRKSLADSYPQNPDGTWPWGYLWAITIPCDRCSRRFPLLGSLVLRPPYAKNNDPGQSLRIVMGDDDWSVEVIDGVPDQQPTYSSALLATGKKRKGKSARCPYPSCGHVHPLETVKAKGDARQYRDELLAACDLVKGSTKVFRTVSQDERAAALGVDLAALRPFGPFPAVPVEAIPEGNVHTVMASGYGYRTFGSLMCDRQALQFAETARAIKDCAAEVIELGCSADYGKALASFACATLARRLRRATRGCSVQSKGKLDGSASNTVFMSDLFINECNLNFQFDWFETGVDSGPSTWKSLSGNGLSPYETHINGLGEDATPARIRQGNAMSLPYRDATVDVVVTDPPYYDMVEYADGSDLFFVWLRRALFDIEPELFGPDAKTQAGLQNKDDEIILRRVHEPGRVRHDKDFYESSLAAAFKEARRVLRPDGHLVVVFGHSDPEAWRRLLGALRDAGFIVTSAWPARTEAANPGVASIKVTVTIGCQVAPERRNTATAAQVEREVTELVRGRVSQWDEWGLALSDQLMASYGPAMQIVGRYRSIQRPDGSQPELDHFMTVGRRAVIDAHAFKIDELPLDTFDPQTRFSIFWMRAFKRSVVNKGEAVFHAQSSQMRIDELRPHILDEAKGGYVMTLGPPPNINDRSPTIHVARAVAAAWPEGATEAVAQVMAASARPADDPHLWATIGELVRQLPESDAIAMALTACQRNRRPIETATKHAIAADDQLTLDPTGEPR